MGACATLRQRDTRRANCVHARCCGPTHAARNGAAAPRHAFWHRRPATWRRAARQAQLEQLLPTRRRRAYFWRNAACGAGAHVTPTQGARSVRAGHAVRLRLYRFVCNQIKSSPARLVTAKSGCLECEPRRLPKLWASRAAPASRRPFCVATAPAEPPLSAVGQRWRLLRSGGAAQETHAVGRRAAWRLGRGRWGRQAVAPRAASASRPAPPRSRRCCSRSRTPAHAPPPTRDAQWRHAVCAPGRPERRPALPLRPKLQLERRAQRKHAPAAPRTGAAPRAHRQHARLCAPAAVHCAIARLRFSRRQSQALATHSTCRAPHGRCSSCSHCRCCRCCRS